MFLFDIYATNLNKCILIDLVRQAFTCFDVECFPFEVRLPLKSLGYRLFGLILCYSSLQGMLS